MASRPTNATSTALGVVLALALVVAATAGCSGSDPDGQDASGGTVAAGSGSDRTVPSGCGSATVPPPGTGSITFPTAGGPRQVERVIPAGYDGTVPRPLILDIHGATSNVEQQDLFSDLAVQGPARGYVVLTPQGADAVLPIGDEQVTGAFWNVSPDLSEALEGAQDDIGFLTALIDSTEAELCIDPARIYMTGFSNGAGMSAAMACAMPGRLAAIAPVSGINIAPTCDDLEPVSVIAFHGDADPLALYGGGSAAGVEIGSQSVEASVGGFAAAAGCDPDPQPTTPYDDVVERAWTGCQPGVAVELFTVVGGGHTWPGMLNYVDVAQLAVLASNEQLVRAAGTDIAAVAGHMTTNLEATATMLDFFDAHPRP